MIAAPIALRALAGDQAAPLQIAQRRGQRRLVAPGGAAEHGLADAGIAADQRQQREAAGTEVDLADLGAKAWKEAICAMRKWKPSHSASGP